MQKRNQKKFRLLQDSNSISFPLSPDTELKSHLPATWRKFISLKTMIRKMFYQPDLFHLLDSVNLSKSALKNKKRAEKRSKARIEQIKENGGVLEAMQMKDPVDRLREQLQEAKNNKDHKLAARLRQQLWIAQDSAAGVSLEEVEMLGADTSSCSETKFVQETKSNSESPPQVSQASGLTPSEKRLRTLKKKLQQIESIKEKREKGEVLETTQLDKIAKEQEILDELREIESLLTGS